MSQLLNYAELDQAIQRRMSNQAPDSDVRLEAINDALNNIQTEYDIESVKREIVANMVLDGRPINLDNIASDIKNIADLRYLAPSKHDAEFTFRDDDEFVVHIGQGLKLDEYTVVYNDGVQYIKVNSSLGLKSKQLHGMTSLTNNGSWTADTANSDAKALSTTEVTVLEQSEAIRFDIDVSQSANDYALIYNADMASVDLSSYVNLGRVKFWIYLPSVTDFTSISLRWGSSSSAYWEDTVTAQANGSALIAGWNYVEFNWENATKTSTPDESAIDYLAIKLNYTGSFTDQTKVVIEKIEMFLPTPMKLVYNTYYLAKDADGTFQEEMDTDTDDKLLIPRRYKELIIAKALQILWPIAIGDDSVVEVAKARNKEKAELRKLGLDIGKKIKTPTKKIKLHSEL